MKGVVHELAKFYRMISFRPESYFLVPKSDGSKVERLFQQYLLGKDEDELKADLYADGSEKAFMMLRKDLAERLYKYVLVMDPAKLSTSVQVQRQVTILKNAISARILLFLGLYRSGLHLAKHTIRDAQKAEIWDIVYSLSSVLSTYFSLRDNFKSFKEYDDLADRALTRLGKERKLRSLINKWSLIYARRRKATQDEILELKGDCDVGDRVVEDAATPNLLHFNYRLKLLYYDAIMDYEKAISICKEAMNRLTSDKRNPDIRKVGIYNGTQMYCYLNLKKFSDASAFAEKFEEYFVAGTLNWYISTEYYFVLCIQTNRFESAYEQLQKALNNRTYGQLRGMRAQMWNLFEGYMQFVISSGLWNAPEGVQENRRFKVAKFLNEVVSLSGDKTGIHVSVLILQIMFLLQQERYGDIIDRKDALRRYVYRYLYSKENERSRIFLSMLLRMIECDFSYAITKTKTQRLLKSLTEQQMNYQANLGGNEIVDYEVLWNWALDAMKGNLTRNSKSTS